MSTGSRGVRRAVTAAAAILAATAGLGAAPALSWGGYGDSSWQQSWGDRQQPTDAAVAPAPADGAPAAQTPAAPAGAAVPGAVAASTCSTDSSLPAPVAGTVVDTVSTVQSTASSTAGQAPPVDVAGTLGSQLGCTSATPSPDDTSTDGSSSGDATATSAADQTSVDSAPAATPATPVSGDPNFAG